MDSLDLSGDGGVLKTVLTTPAEDDPKPTKGMEVLVNYEGKLADGTVFDTTFDKGPQLMIVGVNHLIKGVDMGLMSMKLHEKAELVIKPEYGYGNKCSPPPIPDGSTLTYTIELLGVNERRPTRWMMSDDEMLLATEKRKSQGNELFKAKKFDEAETKYREALGFIYTCQSFNQEQHDL